MNTLKGEKIQLRALEPEDLSFLSKIENDESFWEVSNSQQPLSNFVLRQYLENSYKDIYEVKQLRFVIETIEPKEQVGLIDLFDFEPKHKRVGIGIVILKEHEQNGYATESLSILIKYCFTHLDLHQIFVNIIDDNEKSIKLFEKHNFKKTGEKKDWIYSNSTFKTELTYQLIND